MVTLWLLLFGFTNAGGSVTPYGEPVLQALATYRTLQECDAGQQELQGLQAKGFAGTSICLPTGISDPVTRMALPVHAQRGSN